MFSSYVTAMPSAALPPVAALRIDVGASLVALALICVVVLAGLVAACARRVQSASQAPLRAVHGDDGRGKRRAA